MCVATAYKDKGPVSVVRAINIKVELCRETTHLWALLDRFSRPKRLGGKGTSRERYLGIGDESPCFRMARLSRVLDVSLWQEGDRHDVAVAYVTCLSLIGLGEMIASFSYPV